MAVKPKDHKGTVTIDLDSYFSLLETADNAEIKVAEMEDTYTKVLQCLRDYILLGLNKSQHFKDMLDHFNNTHPTYKIVVSDKLDSFVIEPKKKKDGTT